MNTEECFETVMWDKYSLYKNALAIIGLDTLNDCRQSLSLSFAQMLEEKEIQNYVSGNKIIHLIDNVN